jgi:hypothetical protein
MRNEAQDGPHEPRVGSADGSAQGASAADAGELAPLGPFVPSPFPPAEGCGQMEGGTSGQQRADVQQRRTDPRRAGVSLSAHGGA